MCTIFMSIQSSHRSSALQAITAPKLITKENIQGKTPSKHMYTSSAIISIQAPSDYGKYHYKIHTKHWKHNDILNPPIPSPSFNELLNAFFSTR